MQMNARARLKQWSRTRLAGPDTSKAKTVATTSAEADRSSNRHMGTVATARVSRTDEETLSYRNALLSLPGELRLEILRHIVGGWLIYFSENRSVRGDDSVWSEGRLSKNNKKLKVRWIPAENVIITDREFGQGDWSNPSVLRLLLTCRKLHREAAYMLYTDNVFDFDNLLTFGDLAEHSSFAVKHIRILQVRHVMPIVSEYNQAHPPRGLPAAVKSSWDGPIMFLHFVSQVMPQLQDLILTYEEHWLGASYAIEYHRRHVEWIRFIDQLVEYTGRPNFLIRSGNRYTKPRLSGIVL